MAPKPKPWLRLYTEVTRDRKLRREKPETRWLWIAVLCLARSSPQPGRLMLSDGSPVDVEDLADEAAITLAAARRGVARFRSTGMLTLDERDGVLCVTQWGERQFASDRATDRSRRHRESNGDATAYRPPMQRPSDGDATAPEVQSTENQIPAAATDHSGRPPGGPEPQALRRAAALVARAIADREATGSPGGLATVVAERILLGPDPTDRERIAAALVAGESPEVIAVGWLDGRNPATGADQPGPVGAAGSVVVEQSRPRLAPVVAAPVPSAEERAAGLALARSARSALSGPTPASGPMGPTTPGRPGGAAVGGNAGTLGSVHAVRVAGGAS